MERMKCNEVRDELLKEWERFRNYNVEQVKNYIRYNFNCSYYTIIKLSHEFAGK